MIVRIGELADSSMVAWPLLPYRLSACASPDYILRHGEPQTPTDLQHHACLVYGHWSAGSACRWQFEKQGAMFEIKPSGRFRANDWKALMNAAIAGHGITLGPEDVLKTEVERVVRRVAALRSGHLQSSAVATVAGSWSDWRYWPGAGLHSAGFYVTALVSGQTWDGCRHGDHGLRRRSTGWRAVGKLADELFCRSARKRRLAEYPGAGGDLLAVYVVRYVWLPFAADGLASLGGESAKSDA